MLLLKFIRVIVYLLLVAAIILLIASLFILFDVSGLTITFPKLDVEFNFVEGSKNYLPGIISVVASIFAISFPITINLITSDISKDFKIMNWQLAYTNPKNTIEQKAQSGF